MPAYKPNLSAKFRKDVDDLAYKSKNIRDGLAKDIPFILEKPYYKAVKVEGENGLMRKHICANRFRIFYFVVENKKEVEFVHLRPKNKNTYKNL